MDALVDKFVFPTVKIVVGISVVLIALTVYILKVSGVLDGKKKRKK